MNNSSLVQWPFKVRPGYVFEKLVCGPVKNSALLQWPFKVRPGHVFLRLVYGPVKNSSLVQWPFKVRSGYVFEKLVYDPVKNSSLVQWPFKVRPGYVFEKLVYGPVKNSSLVQWPRWHNCTFSKVGPTLTPGRWDRYIFSKLVSVVQIFTGRIQEERRSERHRLESLETGTDTPDHLRWSYGVRSNNLLLVLVQFSDCGSLVFFPDVSCLGTILPPVNCM